MMGAPPYRFRDGSRMAAFLFGMRPGCGILKTMRVYVRVKI